MKLKRSLKIKTKEKISLPILFLGLFIIFTFYSNNRFLGITEYYVFPLMIILSSLIFLMNHHSKIKINIEHFCILILIYILVFNLIRFSTGINRGVYISYFIFTIMFFFITQIKTNKKEINFVINSYIFSSVIISLMIIIFQQELDGWMGTYRYTLKFYNHVYIDPNFISSFINVAVVFSLNRVFSFNKKLIKIVYVMITLLISGAVFMTGSRAGMIALFLCYGFVFAENIKLKNIFIGLISIVSLAMIVFAFLPDGITQRMFNVSYLETNQTRLLDWKYGIEAFLDRPIFGYGILESQNVLQNYYNYGKAVHNTYLTFLIHFGIVGSLLIAVIFLKIFIKIYKSKIRVMLATLISLLFTSIMIENNLTITFWSILIINYLVYDFIKRNPEIPIKEVL